MLDTLVTGQPRIGGIPMEPVEQNYRALIELCPDALIVHDGATIVLANDAMVRLMGALSVDHIVGQPVIAFVAPSSRALVEERIRRMHLTGLTPLVDETWRRVDGTEAQVEVAVRNMPGAGPNAAMVILRDVTERRRLEAERERLLAEKELLIQEVHHRVANSLHLVQGLLNLQARVSGNPEIGRHLSEASGRIGTVRSLHSRLQKESSGVDGDARFYMEGVLADLRTALGETPDRRMMLDACEPGALILKADDLVTLGLITAEAVTNAVKYGKGHIRVRLTRDDGHVEVAVEDEGAGFPAGFNLACDGRGLGMRMIASLVRNRNGCVTVGSKGSDPAPSPSLLVARIPLPELDVPVR